MLDVGIDIKAEAAREVQRALERAERDTRMSSAKALAKCAYFVARSAGAYIQQKTGRKRKLRDVIPNPKRTGRGKKAKGARYAIVMLRQDGTEQHLPTNTKRDKRRRISNAGLARATFQVAAGMAGRRSARVSGKTRARPRSFVRVTRKLNGLSQYIRIVNRLTYIEAAFPGIVPHAYTKGATAFVRQFNQEFSRRIKRRWETAA